MYVKHLSFNIEESMILWVLFVLGERDREKEREREREQEREKLYLMHFYTLFDCHCKLAGAKLVKLTQQHWVSH